MKGGHRVMAQRTTRMPARTLSTCAYVNRELLVSAPLFITILLHERDSYQSCSATDERDMVALANAMFQPCNACSALTYYSRLSCLLHRRATFTTVCAGTSSFYAIYRTRYSRAAGRRSSLAFSRHRRRRTPTYLCYLRTLPARLSVTS